jgi:hypothetical protein
LQKIEKIGRRILPARSPTPVRAAQVVPAQVQHDAQQPALEAPGLPQPVQRKVSLEQRFLHQLLGDIFPRDHPQGNPLRDFLEALGQLAEGLRIPGARPVYQFPIASKAHL